MYLAGACKQTAIMTAMKIYSWNVNGIRAVLRKDLFLPFIEQHDPDILCIQETKAHKEQVELELDDYHAHWNSADRKGYSGTAIFSKTKPLDTVNDFPEHIAESYNFADEYGDPNTEGRIIVAEFEDFYVATVYTPNAKDDLTRIPLRHSSWDKAFLEYMKELEAKKPVVFCGDLNVAHTAEDLARPKPNQGKKGFTDEEREGFQNFVDSGFVDTFRMFTQGDGHYSWWTYMGGARKRNVGWRIDYVLVSDALKDRVATGSIHSDVMGSDHCPVSIEVA